MVSKGLKTTVQELNGKFTTSIPTALVNLIDLEKGDKLFWCLNGTDIKIEVVKQ